MPRTAVGLFPDPAVVDQVVHEIEALGFPKNEVRTVDEPASFGTTGVMSFPQLDFEVELIRELRRIGATEAEAEAYRDGLRRGGALVLATGVETSVDAAAAVMNRHGAVQTEETNGAEPELPIAGQHELTRSAEPAVLGGRLRRSDGGACFFVW